MAVITSLPVALERWRRAPDPLLADLIDRLPVEGPEWVGSGRRQRELALQAIRSQELVALEAIFAVLGSTRSVAPATELVEELLAHWPTDPRLTTFIDRLLQQAPWVGGRSMKVWRRLFKLAAGVPDIRQLQWRELDVGSVFPGMARHTIDRLLGTLLMRVFPPPAGTEQERDDWRAQLLQLERLAETRRRRQDEANALVERYRDTSDPDLLAVVADIWQSLGDPRGTFLQLSLQPSLDRAAERERRRLLKAHEKEWLGPIAAVTTARDRVWRQGFLREAKTFVKNDATLEAAVGHPAWWFVERLELGGTPGLHVRPLALVGHPCTPNLRHVGGLVAMRELDAVLRAEKPIRSVGLVGPAWDIPVYAWSLQGGHELDELSLDPAWLPHLPALVASIAVRRVVVHLPGLEPVPVETVREALPVLQEWGELVLTGPGAERL